MAPSPEPTLTTSPSFMHTLLAAVGGGIFSQLFSTFTGALIPTAEAASDGVVRAQRFEVVDDIGKVRATLGVDGGGGAGLTVFSGGMELATLRVDPGGFANLSLHNSRGVQMAALGGLSSGTLWLNDGLGRNRVSLAAGGDFGQATWLIMHDDAGKQMVNLTAGSDGPGSSSLTLSGVAGQPRALLRILNDGASGLGLLDTTGHSRASLIVEPDGTPGFGLLDASERVRAEASLDAYGAPAIGLWDATGTGRRLTSTP